MKSERILKLLDQVDDADLEDAAPTTREAPRLARRVRTLLLAAALAALLALCGVAVYTRWQMPKEAPTYVGDPIEVHETAVYPETTAAESADSQTETAAPDPALSDGWFLQRTEEVLSILGRESGGTKTVTRQRNQLWDREEVAVSLGEDTVETVTFDGETGNLIEISAFGNPTDEGVPMAEEDALAFAQRFYDALPYARGYVFDYVEKYDDHAWSFDFDKSVTLTLFGEETTLRSDYEQVRIVIDPCTGTFLMSNCFYVPLLDDHEASDVPLTREEAVAAAAALLSDGAEGYEQSAELGICLPVPSTVPQRTGTDVPQETGETPAAEDFVGYPYYSVTRLGWIIDFRRETDAIADWNRVCVDLYTGEILSFSST